MGTMPVLHRDDHPCWGGGEQAFFGWSWGSRDVKPAARAPGDAGVIPLGERSTPMCGDVVSVIRVSVQGQLENTSRWLELAKAAEAGGLDTLYVADHPTSPAPFVALAAAATVTERIRLGTCVLNAGRWEPLALASEVATLDVLSDGRTLLGIGAGHTPAEWLMAGVEIAVRALGSHV